MVSYSADIYQRLAQEILKQEGIIANDAKVFVDKLASQLKAEGQQITPAVQAELTGYLTAMQAVIKTGIGTALALPALGTAGAAMTSDRINQLAEQAYSERWPDGLRLSDRLWKWQESVRVGLSKTVQEGIKAGEGVDKVAMALQRTIEREHGGQLFKVVEHYQDDWVKGLHEAATDLIHNPGDRSYWNKVVGEAEDHILELKTTGSRSGAERVLDQMKKAVLKGSEVLADKAVKWWLYDQQQYHLKRIVRTEMATALHRAVIASVEGDDSIIGFQWRLSASHPVTDICDYYANIEMGLGKGVFTKDAVPHHKAHPHCMCLLIPRVTAIAQKGAKTYAEFLDKLPADKREALLPGWVKRLNALGMPLDRLVKDNGLLTQAALKAQMGEERFNAVKALAHAAGTKEYGLKDLTRHKSKTAAMLVQLEPLRHHPEVDRFVQQVLENPKRVDSRVQHYIIRRYQDKSWNESIEKMDGRFKRILTDPASTIHKGNSRYQIRSTAQAGIAIIEPSGTRVSLFPDLNDNLGPTLWTLKSLLD